MAALDVANAKPAWAKGPINSAFKMTLTTTASIAIRTGVRISCCA